MNDGDTMFIPRRITKTVTVHVGPYATVRAIEKSGLSDITYSRIVEENFNTYVYTITGYRKEEQV